MNTKAISAEFKSHRSTQPRPISLSLCGVLVAAGFFLAAPRIHADDTMPASGSVSATDKEFMLAAAQGGMTEVKLGGLAAAQGVRQDVKDFGQMMVKDHTGINDDLKALAAKKSVMLPEELDKKHQAMVDKQGALTGGDFDKAYVAGMVKAHKKDLKAFQAEDAATQDPDIKSFVEKAIPVISAHLQHITDIKSAQ